MTVLPPRTLHLMRVQSARALIVWVLLALVALAVSARAETLRVDLDGRHYLVDLPDDPTGARMIVALHGGGGDPAQFAASSRLGPKGTAQGYAVIFPAGTGRHGDRLLTWNGGYCCGSAARGGVDDDAFLQAVIADAAGRFGLDGDRVFLTGMSNGSIMAETFAARNPRRVAAVAGVAGTMDVGTTRPRGAVALLVIHGTADSHVPYAGGQGDHSLTKADFAPVDAVVQAFLSALPAPLARTDRRIDARDDGTAVAVTDWLQDGKLRLRLMTVEGGEHHWPGARKARLRSGKTKEIDASDEVLRFFAEVQ